MFYYLSFSYHLNFIIVDLPSVLVKGKGTVDYYLLLTPGDLILCSNVACWSLVLETRVLAVAETIFPP